MIFGFIFNIIVDIVVFIYISGQIDSVVFNAITGYHCLTINDCIVVFINSWISLFLTVKLDIVVLLLKMYIIVSPLQLDIGVVYFNLNKLDIVVLMVKLDSGYCPFTFSWMSSFYHNRYQISFVLQLKMDICVFY